MNKKPTTECTECDGTGDVLFRGHLINDCEPCKGTGTTETECECACHINKMKRPYEHDVRCCNEMNGFMATETTLEEKIKEILGLEVSPHGEPNMFLISDSEGNIEEGIDFSDEVKQLEELVSLAVQQRDEEIIEIVKKMHGEHHEYINNSTIGLNAYRQAVIDIIKAINQHNE